MAKFGILIQQYRIDSDRTLESAADLLGISAAYMSEVELGRRPPFSRTRIEKLAAFYNVTPDRLIEEACRECGFVELDTARVSSLQLTIISDLARGAVSEDEWAEIYHIVSKTRESKERSKTARLSA
jgi:transcriptional regulator with XRE-family HTH domain